jgi:hypothetical protein
MSEFSKRQTGHDRMACGSWPSDASGPASPQRRALEAPVPRIEKRDPSRVCGEKSMFSNLDFHDTVPVVPQNVNVTV